MNNRAKYLLKNTIIFTIGSFATKLISFFLIPLYTNVLTTNDYGIIDLVSTICTIAVPILTLNIAESVMRFNLDKNADSSKITKIGVCVLCIGSLFGLLLFPICNYFESISAYSCILYFYIIFFASKNLFLCDLRGKELLVQYSIGNILDTFLIAVFNILFLVVFKCGIKGYFFAYTMADFIVTIYAIIIGKSYKSLSSKFDVIKLKEMVKFSIVLIPNSLMWWIMNSSDHIMVTSMIGASANGIYAISYKFPNLIATITGIFNQAWQYSAIKEEGADDENEYNNRALKVVVSGVMLLGVGMLAVIKPLLKWYVSESYFDSWKYSPFLIVGCVYLTLGTFISTSYTVHKDSKGFLISGTLGAVVNIILNLLLIPIIDVYGAALSTCVSYIVVFVFRAIHTQKYIKYDILTKEFVLGTLFLLFSLLLIYVGNVVSQICQLFLLLLLTIVLRNMWFPLFKSVFRKGKRRVK